MEVYPNEMCEVLNKNFQKVFTAESDFKKTTRAKDKKIRCGKSR